MSLALNIVICANDTYIDYAEALVASILDNSGSSNIIFHLFDRDVDSNLVARLRAIVSHAHGTVIEHHLPEAVYRQLPAKDYKSLDAYSRLFAPRLVGEGVNRLIYLDIDTIVRANLFELIDLDLQGNTIAAIRDLEYEKGEGKSPLFNSGVMLIDVKRWRDRHIEEQVLQEIRYSPGGIVPLADQDDLNEILHDDWLELSPAWNVMTGNIYKNEIKAKDAKILHFNGGTVHKPDHPLCVNPGKIYYFKYLKLARKQVFPIPYVPVILSKILSFRPRLRVLQ